MSVFMGNNSSSRSVIMDTALAADEDSIPISLPRYTPSAAPAHRNSRGLTAILVSFDKKVQHAIHRLCYERIVLLARLRAEQDRLNSIPQNLYRDPDVLNRLKVAVKDNEYNITKMAGKATPAIFACLEDPAVQASLNLATATEEDAGSEDNARLWRRKLNHLPIPVRLDAPYRHTTHDSPTVRGDRDLHNKLSAQTGEEGLSYYQKQQLKYGRGRRGSTSIAGAWETVFSEAQNSVDTSSSQNFERSGLSNSFYTENTAYPPDYAPSNSYGPTKAVIPGSGRDLLARASGQNSSNSAPYLQQAPTQNTYGSSQNLTESPRVPLKNKTVDELAYGANAEDNVLAALLQTIALEKNQPGSPPKSSSSISKDIQSPDSSKLAASLASDSAIAILQRIQQESKNAASANQNQYGKAPASPPIAMRSPVAGSFSTQAKSPQLSGPDLQAALAKARALLAEYQQ